MCVVMLNDVPLVPSETLLMAILGCSLWWPTVQSGIAVGKLLTEKRKREAKLRRKQEEEEKKAVKEAKRQVRCLKLL